MTLDNAELIVLGILGIGGAYAAWRMRRVTRGVVFRTWLLALLSVGYLGTFLAVGGVTAGILPDWAVALEIAFAIVAGILTCWYAWSSSKFRVDERGRWIFQGRVVILALWFGLFASRVVLEFLLVGTIYVVDKIPVPVVLTTGELTGFVVVESLFSIATGILFGSNVGVYLAYRDAKERVRRSDPPSALSGAPIVPAEPPMADAAAVRRP